jgi:stage V sporulation protein AD
MAFLGFFADIARRFFGKKQEQGNAKIMRDAQDVHAGASGCGCSASVLCSHILSGLEQGRWHSVLFMATGAMMSPTSSQQGETIPGIAHLIHFCS